MTEDSHRPLIFEPGKILDTWLPISQFDTEKYLEKDSVNFEFSDTRILIFGYEVDDPDKEMKIWPMQLLYRSWIDNSVLFSTEIWRSGDWLDVVPIMYMEVSIPQIPQTTER